MRPLPFVLLLAACAQAPQPAAPERAEPVPRTAIAATVAGTIHHAAQGEAGFASVTISRGDSDDYLDAPIKRVAAMDVPTPYSPPLEAAALPNKDKVLAAARELLAY